MQRTISKRKCQKLWLNIHKFYQNSFKNISRKLEEMWYESDTFTECQKKLNRTLFSRSYESK